MSGVQSSYFKPYVLPHIFTKKTLNSWACMELVIFHGFSQGLQYDSPHPNQAPR